MPRFESHEVRASSSCRIFPTWLTALSLGLTLALPWALPARGEVDEFAGTNLLTGALFLPTGSGSPLVRSNIAWSAPANLRHPALVFVIGFATQERMLPGEFFDSLTVTLRDATNGFVAPVLTVDALGTTVAPENPGGGQLPVQAVEVELLEDPPVSGAFASRQAVLAMVALPPELTAQSGTLRLSLFDNGNTDPSLGFISHVTVVPGPQTGLFVESSAAVNGPYAPEGVTVQHARRRITMPAAGAHRFFRLEASTPTRFISLELADGQWLFRYTADDFGVTPRLVSSAQAAGPYAPESGVVADLARRTLRLPHRGAARFFRLNSEIPLSFRSISFEGTRLVFRYE